jgi:hypothetical protein
MTKRQIIYQLNLLDPLTKKCKRIEQIKRMKPYWAAHAGYITPSYSSFLLLFNFETACPKQKQVWSVM